jgi:hypothetical protein
LTDQQAFGHIVVLLDQRAQPPVPLLIVGKSAFTQQEALLVGQIAQQVDFAPLLLPGLAAPPPLDGVATGIVTFEEMAETMPDDFSPTTDDRPFFYQFERGVPRTLQPLLWGTAAVLIVGGALLVVDPWQLVVGRWRWSPAYFAALGLGFIMIEIGIIQKTRLFLGHPTLAITTVLAALLVGGGVGSGLAGRLWPGKGGTLPAWPPLGVIGTLVLWALVWPLLSGGLTAVGPALRVVVTAASLLPLSLFMGMPFPLGLRTAAHLGKRQVASAWMVNGITSVAGSILAIVLAILAGFTMVLAVGGVMYAAAAGITLLLQGENE